MPVLANVKHEAVAQALLADADRVGWRAYQKVYPKSSQHSCETAISRLLKNAEFNARVEELSAAVAEKTVEKAAITKERVLAELAKIGFANMGDFIGVTTDGDPYVDLSQLTEEQAAAISQISVEDFKDGRGDDARDVRKVTFKLHDKRAALVDIGKHLGLFKEQVELTGKNGGAIQVADVSVEEAVRRLAFALAKKKHNAKSPPKGK